MTEAKAPKKRVSTTIEKVRAKLADHQAWLDGKGSGDKAVFRNTLFDKMDLSDLNFSETRLIAVEFRDCKFNRANFFMAHMTNSKMVRCMLSDCNLGAFIVRDCDFSNSLFGTCEFAFADFERVKLSDSSFEDSKLCEAHFIECNLKRDCILDGVKHLDTATILEG